MGNVIDLQKKASSLREYSLSNARTLWNDFSAKYSDLTDSVKGDRNFTWEFFLTIATTYWALQQLLATYSKTETSTTEEIIEKNLLNWHPQFQGALKDLNVFISNNNDKINQCESIGRKLELLRFLTGLWLIWNLTNKAGVKNENDLSQILGGMIYDAGTTFWGELPEKILQEASLIEKKLEEDPWSNPKNDFGSYLKEKGLNKGDKVVITQSFSPGNLILFPDGISSITAKIADKVVSFDFGDEVLKVFVYVFQQLKLIDRNAFSKMIQEQDDEPIQVSFMSNDYLVVVDGLGLNCEIGESQKSSATGEEFTPLIINSAEMINTPVGRLIFSQSH